jgi:hypothetical protein
MQIHPNSERSHDPQGLPAKEIQKKVDLLTEVVNEAIAHTRHRRNENRRRASLVKMVTIILSGIAAVLLGLQISGLEILFKEIAFALVTFVTVVNAIEPFFNFRALWVEHEAAQAEFYSLKRDLNYYLAGTDAEELDLSQLDQFHEEYQRIWKNLSRSWIQHRRSAGLS